MTQRIRGLGFGKYIVGFIGVVAMATLITGAVAASTAPSTPSHDQTTPNADPTGTAGATALATIKATEAPESAATLVPSNGPAPTAIPKPGASCNPSLDNQEDVSENKAGDQSQTSDDQSPNAFASPTVSPTPEPSEPPTCLKADPDSHGDQMSGKTAEPSAGIVVDDGPGHSQGGSNGAPGGEHSKH